MILHQTRRSAENGNRICKRMTRHHARTFYLSSHALPRSTRQHAYAVYGFCRWTDDGVDCARDDEEAIRRLESAREALDLAYGSGAISAGLSAFRRTVKTRGIPQSLFADLLDGMEMDLTITRYSDFAALERYCYRVAGVVGLMMTHVFGYRHERCLPHAIALGMGMQLTNILRDIREDYERGRIYLPLEEMDRFGISESQIAAGQVDSRFREFMRFQIARARRYYADSELGIGDLIGPSSRMTVRLMGRLYGGILDEIERLDYDVFRSRARVPGFRKLRTIASCGIRTISDVVSLGAFG